jgi:predicted HTH domain antitoxin
METVNVSGLKNNPSEALRLAHRDIVIVMNRNVPDAVLVGIDSLGALSVKGVRAALATALFRDGSLSLGRAAQLAEMTVSEFVSHVSRLGVPVVKLEAAEARQDMDTLEEWLASS